MVARRFVVRQGPAAGAGEAEEHALEYDTEHGIDVLRFQIFSLTSVPPELQKIIVEADGSVVNDDTDLGVVSERLRVVAIGEDEAEGDAAAEAARAQEKSDEELARMLQIVVEGNGSVANDDTNLEVVSKPLPVVGEDEAEEDATVEAARALEKSDEELVRMIVVEGDEYAVNGTNLDVSERLRIAAMGEDEAQGHAVAEEAREQEKWAQERSDEQLARMLQAEEDALLLQQYNVHSDGGEEFRQRVEPYMHQVLMYEDPVRQEAARKTVPIVELEEKALVSLAKEGNFNPSKDEENHAFLLQLLFWFKQSFSWVNAAPCDSCGRETSIVGMGTPLPSEIKFGATRVEIYRCNYCSSITRFPRYNDPHKLIETRKGRCGEWANCFTFYCRSLGYEARLIQDFTDHVWTECFSKLYGRWMHLDPCEGVYDNPLLYEKGWNKKLNYVIAISKDGVRDVTKRYTRNWPEVLSRRTITSEDTALAILTSITEKYRSGLSSDALSVIESREKEESEELCKSAYLQDETNLSLPGRLSGSVEWRKARSEMGQADSLSCSSCPVRKCVDAHVSEIYNALSALLSHFYVRWIPKERIVETFDTLKTLMLNLKDANFKNRRATLENSYQLLEEIFPCIEKLLSAISLKAELGTDGHRHVSAVGNPINSSLALPVALDAIDEVLSNCKTNIFGTEGNQLPRSNRLCSGSVLASREQLPHGIATAAFDGIRSSKWEEPEGAKGCWLIYKLLDGQSCELKSYDLMSANDAPERDPMDWVLEGSADRGSTWETIDTRSSELFEGRFLRRTFTLSKRYKANAFRFRFLRVRESSSNPRFQIGSIDLYGIVI